MAVQPVGLLKCPSSTHLSANALSLLESGSLPEMASVAELRAAKRYFQFRPPLGCWIEDPEHDARFALSAPSDKARCTSRPQLPDVSRPFVTKEGFRVYFGNDFVAALYRLDWMALETDLDWTHTLVAAYRELGRLFSAEVGLIIGDDGGAGSAIGQSETFDELLAAPLHQMYAELGLGRVRPIEDFASACKVEPYTEQDYWRFL